MRVIAIDGGDAKRDLCKKLGAEHFIDFTTTKDIPAEVMKLTKFGAHGKQELSGRGSVANLATRRASDGGN